MLLPTPDGDGRLVDCTLLGPPRRRTARTGALVGTYELAQVLVDGEAESRLVAVQRLRQVPRGWRS